ncbi:IRS4 [Candida theae]|uniref:IRS4 n=1 Tax=Candida theae TaxID=1198502 RepID=A0AAD5FWI8_9ASCO|nr:IRS4 [Candida theae]KAI5948956.1 IRS4 [Candida theae]
MSSSSNSAANLAALAAFNAGKKKDGGNNQSPSSGYNASKYQLQQTQPKRHPSTQKVAPTTKLQVNTSPDASTTLQPAYAPMRPLQANDLTPTREDKDVNTPDYFAHTPRQTSRQNSIKSPYYSPILSPSSPRDMISNVKNSIDSKAIVNDVNAKRLSSDYSPQEMLKSLKDSLNRKSHSQSGPKTMDARGRTILDGVRERIDDNMRETSNNLANLSLKQYEWSKTHSDADVGNYRRRNDSQTSLGTSATDVDPVFKTRRQSSPSNTPGVRIDVTDHDAEMGEKQNNDANDATIKVPVTIPEPDRLSLADSTSHFPVTNRGTRRKPPPPTSSDEERDPMSRHSTSDTDNNKDDMYFDSSDGFSGDELRKQMQLKGMSMDTFSSGEVMLPPEDDMVSFTENDEPDPVAKVKDTKFPQFPDVRKHHQHLFGTRRHRLKEGDKYNRFESGAYSDDDELSESPTQTTPAVPLPQQQLQGQGHSNTSKSNSSSSQQQQPVQFKTTMRKTNKRKDRKTKFDELKPWKTHEELNFPTEQERKRYEGVWVSNKGLYMNLVVTKLTGVDSSETRVQQHDDSMKAALISTNDIQPDKGEENGSNRKSNGTGTGAGAGAGAGGTSHESEEPPISKAEEATNKLHSLKNADVNQLILGAVVKRIWNRSRLPSDVLEQIWNLVDFRRDGSLNKNEFLVGMWLVDQCLYGRKLPKKIEPVVWDSLGGIGVNVNLNSRRWK